MAIQRLISTPCIASSSRFPFTIAKRSPLPLFIRPRTRPSFTDGRVLSFLTSPPRPEPLPFSSHLPYLDHPQLRSKGSNSPPPPSVDPKTPVNDHEWDMRVARAMLHIRETLPHFFTPGKNMSDLFPPDIYSRDIVLKLPAPIPLKISSLHLYTMAFSIARNGMQAFHSNLHTSCERLTFTMPPPTVVQSVPGLTVTRRTSSRNRQIRVQVSVHGSPRLPPHHEATWRISSLYSFCPRTGLINSHEVEVIRPLPGEGVAEWLINRLIGRRTQESEATLCPRTVQISTQSETLRSKVKGNGI